MINKLWHRLVSQYIPAVSPSHASYGIPVNMSYESHNASSPYPTMHHFVAEMCTCVHISVTKWCIVGYMFDALWDLWHGSNVSISEKISHVIVRQYCKYAPCLIPYPPLCMPHVICLCVNIKSTPCGRYTLMRYVKLLCYCITCPHKLWRSFLQ